MRAYTNYLVEEDEHVAIYDLRIAPAMGFSSVVEVVTKRESYLRLQPEGVVLCFLGDGLAVVRS